MRANLAWAPVACLLVAGTTAPASAQDSAPIVITDVRHESSEGSTRLFVEGTGPLAYTYYSPDPLTVVIDMPEVDASKLPSRIAVGSREVESVRITSMARADGRSLARVEVRLASLSPYQIFSKDNVLNVVFEKGAATAAARPAAPAPAPPPAAIAAAVPEPETARTEPAPEPRARKAANVELSGAAPSANPATRITGITQEMENGRLAVTIQADGRLRYQDFFLGNPDRLVVDFTDVVSKAAIRTLDVNQEAVRKLRLGQFSAGNPKVARLVVDLASRPAYRIRETADGLKIVFGEGQAVAPAPLAALRVEPEGAEPASAPVPTLVIAPGKAPAIMRSAVAVPVPVVAAPEPQAPPAPEGPLTQSSPPGRPKYTGHPISLDFKDGDLQDIFRLFADISGFNVVVNPGISGKITLKLVEVPWDQALDLILKANGLGYTLDGNVVRIAKLTELQKEEQELRKLNEEKALTGDLADFSRTVSYAKATELNDVIKKAGALSPRGNITIDARTNTMILRDLPAFLEKARAIIVDLDRPTPQVEIEARIVVTSRNFTRDLGIQWGFNQQRTPGFGNTTNLAFPNAFILNGQGVPSTGGLSADQNGSAATQGIGSGGRGYAVNLPASGFNTALGISMGNILGNFNIDAALTALERQGRGRLLSTPKVTTQNNQAAVIKQGVQIPIQTVANNTVTVTFKDAVLTLAVTPQITDAGTVILQVNVENNAADFANLVNGVPPINTQSATTTVLVRDGATAVIGGIYQSNEQTAQQSTPLLGRLPVLGYLFRNRFVTSTNNELLLFITPRIIKG